jgi:glucosyl-dolichyl phosphate glucuronosyltransferase
MAVDHLVPASRLQKEWFVRRYYWQGISDAVMQLIAERPGATRRAIEAAHRTARLLMSRQKLRALRSSSDDPDAFTEKCFALIEFGHIAGLLGAARR